MSRDSAGNYSPPAGNPVASGTLVEANWANTLVADLGTEMTDSFSRSGKGGMVAPVRGVDGTAALPGYAFTAKTNTGMYRDGAGNLNLVVNGVVALQLTGDPAKDIGVSIGQILVLGVPIGTVATPTYYLPCDSSLVSRTTYAALFAVLGTSWGAGDGSTTFQLPPPHQSLYSAYVFAGV